MSLNKHSDYNKEKDRLKYTVEYVENAISASKENRKRLKTDTKEAFLDLDPSDSSMSYARILTNAKFLDMIEKNYDGLVRAQKKPYFSRIDFKMGDSSKISELYIGKTSLLRAEDEEPLIVDWRSPVASVYYDGRLGTVNYNTPEGTMSGELYLKRQYTINNGKLEGIMDIDITTTDTFLQAALGENKDNRLKDIVSTIQGEQNEIIRADIGSPLIVQGVAGSGKTTIALHRIAYLIYTYEKTFDPDNFLIIAPNRLFLNYISEVLPELGVDQVKQTTFVDLVYELTGVRHKLKDPDEKLIKFINAKDDSNYLLQKLSGFKGSLQFKEAIDKYIEHIEDNFTPGEDFSIMGYVIYKKEQIKYMIKKELSYLPLYKRLNELKKFLSNKLKRDKIIILKKAEEYYDKKIEKLRYTMPSSEERRLMIVKLIDKRDEKIKELKNILKFAVSKYLALFPKNDVMNVYKNIVNVKENLIKLSKVTDENFVSFMCEYHSYIGKKNIEFEDLTPVLYLQYKLFGFEKKMNIKYVVIDEAQDFSLFQIYGLKEIFNTERFTILGDLAQGIHSYRGTKDWNTIIDNVFTKNKCKYLTLKQSYRTTIEIMNTANKVLKLYDMPGIIYGNPVVRHGDTPQLFRYDSQESLINDLEERIMSLKNLYKTIAIICKTDDECEKIKNFLLKNKSLTVNKLGSDDLNYEGGIVLVPSYLAKGLEFDAVIISALEEDYYERELDVKLLYVAMTRALHRLDILCMKNKLTILNGLL